MDEKQHHEAVQRALELGRAEDPDGLGELCELLQKPSPEIRRLAASAVGKLAAEGADTNVAVQALIPQLSHALTEKLTAVGWQSSANEASQT